MGVRKDQVKTVAEPTFFPRESTSSPKVTFTYRSTFGSATDIVCRKRVVAYNCVMLAAPKGTRDMR